MAKLGSVTPEYEMGEMEFELILDREAFTSIHNNLDIGGKNYTVIVTRGRGVEPVTLAWFVTSLWSPA